MLKCCNLCKQLELLLVPISKTKELDYVGRQAFIKQENEFVTEILMEFTHISWSP